MTGKLQGRRPRTGTLRGRRPRLGLAVAAVLLHTAGWAAPVRSQEPPASLAPEPPAPFAVFLLTETGPGSWDAALTLPLDGVVRRPPAVAFPPHCRSLEEGGPGAPPAPPTLARRLACDPPSLVGATLRAEGLDEGGIPLHLEVRTLAGGTHATLLTPSRPEATLPPSTPTGRRVVRALAEGAAGAAGAVELWLVVLAVALAGTAPGAALGGAVAFGGAFATARWLGVVGALATSAHLAAGFSLATALVPAMDLARGASRPRSWTRPAWLAGGLLGALWGGVPAPDGAGLWATGGERLAALVLPGLGASAALVSVGLVAFQLRRLPAAGRAARLAAHGLAVLAVALLVPRTAALALLVPTGVHRLAFELAAFALLAGFAVPALGLRLGRPAALLFCAVLALGSGVGVGGDAVWMGRLLVLGSLFLLSALLASGRTVTVGVAALFFGLAVAGQGWHARQVLDAGAAPLPTAAGAALAAVFLFHAGLGLSESLAPVAQLRLRAARAAGAAGLALAVLWRLGEYGDWLARDVAPDLAAGLLPIPVAALSLLLLAAAARPRPRPVAEALGFRRGAVPMHVVCACLAFFVLPLGTVTAPNPLFHPATAEEDASRRIVSDALWSTYLAFNLEDEEELYDRLSESVTADLVADLYLDSRRRLAAGTAEGDEVVVRDVAVGSGRAVEHGGSTSALTWTGEWVVTATVRHLQHAHQRRNVYTGSLLLRLDDGRWKIAAVVLTGEDRAVLAWGDG